MDWAPRILRLPGEKLAIAGFAPCAFSLQLPVDVALRLAQFARDALESFFLVNAGFGLQALDAACKAFGGLRTGL